MKKKVFIGLLVFLSCNTCFAANEITKNLSLMAGHPYLLSFDEKIVRYQLENSKAISIEPLVDIFNEKKELFIKPSQNSHTNLLVWTTSNVYKFNISTDNILNNSSPGGNCIEFDKPPCLPGSDMIDFDLDKPPGVN